MAIPSLAEEIRAYITSGALPPPRPGQEESLENTLERWAKRAAALAQIRDELLHAASKADGYRFALNHACVLIGLALHVLRAEGDVKGARYYAQEALNVIMEALRTDEKTKEKVKEA